MFNCPNCKAPMIWGGDHNNEDADGVEYIISNFHCNDCNTWIEYAVPMVMRPAPYEEPCNV